MRKTLTILLTCVFCLGAFTVAGCGDPCEKAVDKMIECMSEDGEMGKEMGEAMKKERDSMIKKCKEGSKEEKDKMKKCVKESDCKKFMECMMKE